MATKKVVEVPSGQETDEKVNMPVFDEKQEIKGTIYEKIAKLRAIMKIKRGTEGYGYSYFSLDDFLEQCNKACAEVGLCPLFHIEKRKETIVKGIKTTSYPDGSTVHEEVYEEQFTYYGVLDVRDTEIPFANYYLEVPTCLANVKNASAIQNFGAMQTYTKRYLYQHLLEVNDGSDTQVEESADEIKKANEVVTEKPKAKAKKKETPQVIPADEMQINLIQNAINSEQNPEEVLKAILEMYSVKDLKELSVEQASDCLERFN